MEVFKMNNAKLLNDLLKKFNATKAKELLIDELGPERVEYEFEKFGFDKLTKDNFIELASEWSFFEDYITDENWEIYNPFK